LFKKIVKELRRINYSCIKSKYTFFSRTRQEFCNCRHLINRYLKSSTITFAYHHFLS